MFLLRVFLLTAAVYVQFTVGKEETCVLNMLRSLIKLETEVRHLKAQMADGIKTVAFTVHVDTSLGSKVLTNIGGGYNSKSGIFTCPVKGLYYFSVQLIAKKNTDEDGIYIRKNNRFMVNAYTERSDLEGSRSATLVTTLDVGDTIDLIKQAKRPNPYFSFYFSGMKIH